jgi:putative tryptophan/tyrosine transport system substrate-binding protein
MKRREFITLLGGAAVNWPLKARAQQGERMRRIGVLMALPETNRDAKALLLEFKRGLAESGWTDGGNILMDIRWAGGDVDLMRKLAIELVSLNPDVILANSTPVTLALQRETQTIPIVFVIVGDPEGSGFVASFAHPGRNITGLALFDASIASKWLDLLTQIAPGFSRVTFMFNPDTAPYIRSFLLPSFEDSLKHFKIAGTEAPVRGEAEIEAAIAALAREPKGMLIVGADNFMDIHRRFIIALTAKYAVPAIYHSPESARDGGLIAYGADFADIFHRAARYVDRILRGDKAIELPVQLPIKYLMIVNLQTAKALGLAVPPSLLVSADQVVE